MVAPLIAVGARAAGSALTGAGKSVAKNGIKNATKITAPGKASLTKARPRAANDNFPIAANDNSPGDVSSLHTMNAVSPPTTQAQETEERPIPQPNARPSQKEDFDNEDFEDMPGGLMHQASELIRIRGIVQTIGLELSLFMWLIVIAELLAITFWGTELGARYLAGSTLSGIVDYFTGLPPGALFLVFHAVAFMANWVLTIQIVSAFQTLGVRWFNTVSFVCLGLSFVLGVMPILAMVPWGIGWGLLVYMQKRVP